MCTRGGCSQLGRAFECVRAKLGACNDSCAVDQCDRLAACGCNCRAPRIPCREEPPLPRPLQSNNIMLCVLARAFCYKQTAGTVLSVCTSSRLQSMHQHTAQRSEPLAPVFPRDMPCTPAAVSDRARLACDAARTVVCGKGPASLLAAHKNQGRTAKHMAALARDVCVARSAGAHICRTDHPALKHAALKVTVLCKPIPVRHPAGARLSRYQYTTVQASMMQCNATLQMQTTYATPLTETRPQSQGGNTNC